MNATAKAQPHELITRMERNALLYAECCIVDHSGLLEGMRMNSDDLKAFDKFKEAGILDYGRIPGRMLIDQKQDRKCTHWITFYDGAWTLAQYFRREVRAKQISKFRQEVDEELAIRREKNLPVEG